ncbi:MAG TPA: hypothetical protein VHX52_10060 [Steroidobacteraceae bacterium]|jgi:hypothetical protein|nr:hypothetical protein [Steroidobacteraceae bacterium]
MKVTPCFLAACGLAAVSVGQAQVQPAATAPAAYAGSATASTEAPPLEEVLVTAKSLEDELPQQLSQYGTHEDTVSAAQIQNGGFIDVAEALQIDAPDLDNLLNKVYDAQLDVGYTDANGTPYIQHDLGLRRTFEANYTYTF